MPTPDLLPRNAGRVILRRLEPADLPDFQAYRQDEDLGRFQGWVPTPDSEALKERVLEVGIDREPRTWERPSDHAPVWVRLLERVGMQRIETRDTEFRGEPCVEHVYAASRTSGAGERGPD